MFQLCAPAFIYVLISILDIIFNAYTGLYNNLLIKTIVILSVALLLNILCEKGFSKISWLIVLLAFMFIVIIVLNNLGCNTYYTLINYVVPMDNNVFATNNKPITNPVLNYMPITHYYEPIPFGTSDPAYQS